MFVVYAIYNPIVNKIYIGQTNDIKARLAAHNNHTFSLSYTARYPGEWKLFYTDEFSTRVEALRREKQLKSYRGREFVRKYIPR